MTHRTGISRVLALAALTWALVAATTLPAQAISRTDVLARGRVWVDGAVPYSQSRYATVDGVLLAKSVPSPWNKGYRTDCSGFVSMALGFRKTTGLPYSADTAGLGQILVKIKKSELRPGDVILRPKDLVIDGQRVPYGHAVLFGGWTDSSKTYYWGLHESSSNKGTVMAKIRYGTSGFYSDLGYAPYRYAGVRDRVRAPKTFGR